MKSRGSDERTAERASGTPTPERARPIETDPVRPDYAGLCVTGLAPALVGAAEVTWLPDPVAGATAVVFLLLDGLGWHALEEHRAALPALAGLTGGPITTVAPSTTASALTSVVTGLAPSQHGITGFRMLLDGSVLNVLLWRQADGRRGPDPFTVQRHGAFLGREVPVVTRSEFRESGFSEAHLRGTRFVGWGATSTLVEHCRRLVATGERLVYAYYPGIDTVAHEFGLHDGYFEAELRAADRLVAELRAALPERAALLVTSDHGQVHLDAGSWVGLAPLDDLVAAYSGDGRFRYLHARRGAAAELRTAAEETVGHEAWVLARDELLERGWLGPEATPAARRRVGDVVLAARQPVAFVDPLFSRETRLLAAHGSLTPDEMLVPLLAGRGEGA